MTTDTQQDVAKEQGIFFNQHAYLAKIWQAVHATLDQELDFTTDDSEVLSLQLQFELQQVFERHGLPKDEMAIINPFERQLTMADAQALIQRAQDVKLGKECMTQRGPNALKLFEVAQTAWMLDKAYCAHHTDEATATTEDQALEDTKRAVEYFGVHLDREQTRASFEQAISTAMTERKELWQERLMAWHECYQWTRPGGTNMTVHVRWEIVPSKDREVVESCQGQVTACVIQDRLENLTYGGGYENISLVEFLNEFAKHHAQPEAINPEK